MAVLRRYVPAVLKYPWLCAAAILSTVILQLAALASPWYMRSFFNLLASPQGSVSRSQFLLLLYAILAISLIGWLMRRVRGWSQVYLESRVMSELAQEFGSEYSVSDWSKTQGNLFQSVKMEKIVTGVLLNITSCGARYHRGQHCLSGTDAQPEEGTLHIAKHPGNGQRELNRNILGYEFLFRRLRERLHFGGSFLGLATPCIPHAGERSRHSHFNSFSIPWDIATVAKGEGSLQICPMQGRQRDRSL